MDRMKEKFTPQGSFFENESFSRKPRDIFFLGRIFFQVIFRLIEEPTRGTLRSETSGPGA